MKPEVALQGEPQYYACGEPQLSFPKWVWLEDMAWGVEANKVRTSRGCMGAGQMMVGEEALGVRWDRPRHCVLRVQAARG